MFGSTDYRPPSRFLDEIPAELIVSSGGDDRPSRGRRSGSGSGDRGERGGGGLGAHREAVVAAALRRDNEPLPGARGAEQLGLRVGDDVRHEKFGDGVIVDITGTRRQGRGPGAVPRRRREDAAVVVGAAGARLSRANRSGRTSSSTAARGRRRRARREQVDHDRVGLADRLDAHRVLGEIGGGDGLAAALPVVAVAASTSSPAVARPCRRRCCRRRARARTRSRRRRSGSRARRCRGSLRTSVALPMFSWPHTTLPLLRVATNAPPAIRNPARSTPTVAPTMQLDVGAAGARGGH